MSAGAGQLHLTGLANLQNSKQCAQYLAGMDLVVASENWTTRSAIATRLEATGWMSAELVAADTTAPCRLQEMNTWCRVLVIGQLPDMEAICLTRSCCRALYILVMTSGHLLSCPHESFLEDCFR